MQGMATGMDLTPLIHDPSLDPWGYVQTFLQRFAVDVQQMLVRCMLNPNYPNP